MASDLFIRPTQDLDLFAASPVTSVAAAKEQLITEAGKRGWTVSVIRDHPTFCRLVISGDDEVLVDLALDSPPATAPQLTILGSTLAPLELAGRKMLALFGRAEIRDFADVHALAQRFGKETLLAEAAAADPGFDVGVLAQMFRSLHRFDDDAFPTAPDQVALRSGRSSIDGPTNFADHPQGFGPIDAGRCQPQEVTPNSVSTA